MRVLSYRRVSELDRLMREFIPLGEDVRFLVPSRRDRSWWLDRSGNGEFGLAEVPTDVLWNWQDLYEDVAAFTEGRRLRPIDPPDHRLILSRLLGDLLKEEPKLLTLWPGLGRKGFLDILSEDIRELLNEAILPEQTEAGLPEDNPTSQVLPRLYRSYLKYLEDNGLMDSAQICTATLSLLESSPLPWGSDFALVLTGFLSFTQAQVRLVRKLNDRCREVIVLKPEADLPHFHDAARQLEKLTWEEEPGRVPGRILRMRTTESELEAEAAARALALWSAGRGPLSSERDFPGFGAVGIMLPSDGEEAVSEALTRYAVPHSAAQGISVDRTLPGRVLSAMWVLRSQGFRTYDTALFLAQPCFTGEEFSVAEALKAGPHGLAGWKAYLGEKAPLKDGRRERRSSALRALLATERFCRVLARGAPPPDLMEAFHKFLCEKGLWLDRLKALPLSYPELDETIRTTASAVDSVREKALALRELLPDIGPLGRQALKGEDAAEFLQIWCRETRIRPTPPLAGVVTLHTGPPPVLASYPVWIMLGVSQRDWPGRIAGSPLLGGPERERLAEAEAWLPSIQDKHLQREALFRRLILTGEEMTILSKAEADDNGRPIPETPFLDRFMADMGDWALRTLPVEGIDILLPTDGHVFEDVDAPLDERARRFDPVAESCGRMEERPLTLAVSDLQTLLECPLRYWLQRRARLRERPLGLVSAADWGALTHKFWERVWRRFDERREGFLEIADAEWRALSAVDTEYTAYAPMIRDRRLGRRREILRLRAMRLAVLQARILERLAQAGFRHRAILLEEDAELLCELEGVRFSGRCDRVEILEGRDGALRAVITDYKTGRSARYEEGLSELERYPWHDGGLDRFLRGLQLSSYALMYARQHSDAVLAGVCLLGHQDGGLAGTFSEELRGPCAAELRGEKKGNRCTLEERQEEARYAMVCAARILGEGRFAPFYGAPSCRYCGMKSVCRRGETVGEALGPEEDPDE